MRDANRVSAVVGVAVLVGLAGGGRELFSGTVASGSEAGIVGGGVPLVRELPRERPEAAGLRGTLEVGGRSCASLLVVAGVVAVVVVVVGKSWRLELC